ncbi:MAG: PKD domain-containing protein [Candidatus Thermoplasmatota archaeon]|jgi:hypothetical protein|nr:PKD domain-containing protein [Candidatus Thermoplasmatota archaeon]
MLKDRYILLALAFLFIMGTSYHVVGSDPPSRDGIGNDSFESADVVYFSEYKLGDLSGTDQIDVYRMVELLGDDEYHVQKVLISVTKLSGADVKGILYEETGARIAELHSSGERSEVGFIVPYDGSLYLSVTTDPVGQDSSYRVETGGETNINNYEYHDGNNRPMVVGFSESADVTDTLNPVRDIVDHRHIDIPPGKSLEVSFSSEVELRMEVYNETYVRFTEKGPNSNFSVKNDGASPLRVLLRMYHPLVGEVLYPDFNAAYVLRMVLWSHSTVPSIVATDPWAAGILLHEDQTDIEPLNLTRHFTEPQNDPLSFEIMSAPVEIGAHLVRVRDSYNPNIVLYQEIRFELVRNWHGDGALTVRAFDRDGEVTDSISVMVQSVNDLPYVTKIGAADYKGGMFNLFAEEDIPKTYEVAYGDDDDPHDSLYFTTNESLSFLSVSTKNGTLTIDAGQEEVGKYDLNLTLFDVSGGWSVVDLRLSIEPVNDPPSEPTIMSLSHPDLLVPPGEEVILTATGVLDIDSTVITYSWEWSDGTTTTGNPGRHTFGPDIHGNRTIKATASDGFLTSTTKIVLYIQSPEDIATGNLRSSIGDRAGDVVSIEERWKADKPLKRDLTIMTVKERGIDILGLSAERRENELEITLEIDSTIEITGAFQYHIFIVQAGFKEQYVDFKNQTDFGSVPDRMPNSTFVYSHRSFLGDPNIFNESQGRIVNNNLLVFMVPFKELVSSGLSSPVKVSDFEIFAVTVHQVPYVENKGQISRFIMTDTAGAGALKLGNISTQDTASGSSHNPFGDFSRPTAIIVVVTLIVLVLIFGTVSFFLVRREREKRRKEEKEFLEKVEKMRSEGKDLFGKEKVEQGSKQVSYEELYGAPAPKGHDKTPAAPLPPSLPGPGLGKVQEVQSNIMEMEVAGPQMEGSKDNSSEGGNTPAKV